MNNTTTMFPAQKLTLKKKNEDWGKACVNYIIGMGETVPSGSDKTSFEEMQVYYNLYNSIFDEKDLKYVTDPFKQDDGFPASPQNFNIIKPKVDLLIGEETKHPFNFRVIRTSQDAASDVQDKMKKMLVDYIMASVTAGMSPKDAADYQERLSTGEILPPEKITSFIAKDYKDVAESCAYHSLNYLKEKIGLDHEFSKGWKDALIAGKEIYYTGVVNGEPHMERVNPMYFSHDNAPDNEFIENGDWACRRMRMSYTEVYDRLYDKMSEEQLDKLLELTGENPKGDRFGPQTNSMMDYTHLDMKNVTGPGDNNLTKNNQINMWHATWKSYKKVGFVTYMDETGQVQEAVVSEDYLVIGTELNIEWKWVIEVWEGYRIGEDIFIGVQPLEYQHISSDNPNSQKLPYSGVLYSNTNSVSKSLVAIMKPLQYMYIIIWYRLELALARDKGKVINMDITQIPKSMNIDAAKWMHYLSAIGVNFINPYEEGWDIPGREGGKCFGRGTKVLMSNGRIKNIEDILVGDLVMGPDGTGRAVLELHNGIDHLYEITPSSGGKKQIVNSRHDIYYGLKNHHTNETTFATSTPIEIMNKFKSVPSCRDKYYLYRSDKVDFNSSNNIIDPYLLGLWIGDGSTNKTEFTSMDYEVIDYLQNYSESHGLSVNIRSIPNNKALSINLSGGEKQNFGYRNTNKNWLRNELRNLGILDFKDIPDSYIYTNKNDRLQLLAGLIDTDGHYDSKKNRYEFVQKRKHISDKFAFIARSLGMKVSERIKRVKGNNYYVVSILSKCSDIPVLIKRKKANRNKFFANDTMRSMFNVEYSGIGEYYGFTTDKDHLFLLDDFTIVHNSASFNQITALDLTMSAVIDQYINLMSKIEDMMSEISGVTKQRTGAISSNELVGNVERSVTQSALITEPLFWMHNQCKKNALRMLLNTAKETWRDSKRTNIQYVLDDSTRTFLTLADNFFYEDYDIFVSDSTKDRQNLESIKSLYQPAMQNGASILDIAEIMTLDSVTAIKTKLAEIEKVRMEQSQQAAEQENQRQMQLVQAQNQVKSEENQIKQQELELSKYKTDTDNETKIYVAELNAYKGAENMDQNANGVPDVMEIADMSLKRMQYDANVMDKQMSQSLKDKEIANKQELEKRKIDSQKRIEENKLSIEKSKIELENKKLIAQKELQKIKDNAAMERERLKAKTAMKNPVSGERKK